MTIFFPSPRSASRDAAFGKQRRPTPPKGQPSPEYAFRHIRRSATPDAIPAMPTLAEALGV